MDSILLYDTTLRDGAQREGISFSVADKLKIARKLDEFGVHYIEGGWPGSNPKDREFFLKMAAEPLRRARLFAFSSTRHAGSRVEDDRNIASLLESAADGVTIVGKCWDFHVRTALKTTLEENLAMIRDTIQFLKNKGRIVFFDAEHFFDGMKHNAAYSLAAIGAAADSGADAVVLCDTNGGMLPLELQEMVRRVRAEIAVPIGIHAHDDAGMAVANSLIAVQNGCSLVQGTINGYGERCGNADLCTLIPNLQLKLNRRCVEPAQLGGLKKLSLYVAEIANVPPLEQQPYVSNNAFTHKGGIHVSAVNKNPQTYEHVEPEAVGNTRQILVSELAGNSNITYKARTSNLNLSRRYSASVLAKLKMLEHKGYQFEGAEGSFELLIWKTVKTYRPLFELHGFRVVMEKRRQGEMYCEATIKVQVDSRQVHTAADGNGPVNALDNALRKALEEIYPALKKIKLVDYKVRVLDGKDGTGALVRVLIESRDDKRSWGTVGVSENIVEASWIALVDSLEYGLLYEKCNGN